VTRVARVTGLDRSGVEVACAVRPGGHVLQVTNGKGLTAQEAAEGALLEAAELWCAERVDPKDLSWGAPGALRRGAIAHLGPDALGFDADPGAPIAWTTGADLFTGQASRIPAAAVHVPPPGGPLLGLARVRWTSNGMGAHPSWPAALLHALLEAVERDALGQALPEGWTGEAVADRRMAPSQVAAADPRLASLTAALAAEQLEAHLFDLRPRPWTRRGTPLFLAGALLFDQRGGQSGGPVPLTAGYACRLAPAAALQAALLEAAQSRLTDIHGAREDVAAADHDGAAQLREACAAAARSGAGRPPARPRAPARPPPSAPAAVRAVLDHLWQAGHRRAVAVDLAPAELPVRVAKVLVPGLQLSGLL
jgi:ribosomal protein S12 methylthiotransferase accessory factor